MMIIFCEILYPEIESVRPKEFKTVITPMVTRRQDIKRRTGTRDVKELKTQSGCSVYTACAEATHGNWEVLRMCVSRRYGVKTVRTAPHSAVSKDASMLTCDKLTLERKRGTRDALKRPMRALQRSRSIPIFAGNKGKNNRNHVINNIRNTSYQVTFSQ